MLLQKLIDTYEELKKYIYIIDRGNFSPIIIRFKNENFYHLVGLHKTNLHMFFPEYIKSMDKRYKHMKKYTEKYNSIIINQIDDKDSLQLRLNTFSNILELLKGNNTNLYDVRIKNSSTLFEGDYCLYKIFESNYCLLGIKYSVDMEENHYVPQSWMASTRPNQIISNRPPKFFDKISAVPLAIYQNRVFENV